MASKTVDFTGVKIQASQIADFYTRLNALRSLNGGSTTVSFSSPSVGSLASPANVTEMRDAVLSTKSALSFLAGVNLTTHAPTVPSSGSLIQAKTTISTIEWQVGQLESACFTNFTTNRSGVNISNFSNFDLTPTATFTSNKSGHCTNFSTVCATQQTANFNPNCVTVFNPNFGSVNTPHGCAAAFSPFRSTDNSPVFSSTHGTHCAEVWSAKRAFVNTSFQKSNGCLTYGTNFNSTHFATVKGTNRAANYGSQYFAQHAPVFWTVFSPNVCNSVYAPYFGSVFTTQFVTQNSVVFGPVCTANHSPFGCSTVHTSVKTSNNTSNCVGNNSTNFSANTATYYANHATFTVTPL